MCSTTIHTSVDHRRGIDGTQQLFLGEERGMQLHSHFARRAASLLFMDAWTSLHVIFHFYSAHSQAPWNQLFSQLLCIHICVPNWYQHTSFRLNSKSTSVRSRAAAVNAIAVFFLLLRTTPATRCKCICTVYIARWPSVFPKRGYRFSIQLELKFAFFDYLLALSMYSTSKQICFTSFDPCSLLLLFENI